MTDAQIVMSIMQNDSRGWRYICRNMKQGFAAILARSFSFGRTANADIEDIFQDSCIVLMQKVKEGKFAITGEHSVFKFLVKIGINNACNFIRKHRPLTSKEEVTVTLNLHDDNQDVELSVDEQQKAQDDFLDRVFDSLPDTCKAIFKKFVEYYDADVFAEAGTQIRKLAKSADKLPPTRRVQQIARIFSYFKNPDKETVLTPWRVVNMHLADTIGGWCFFDENFEKPLEDAPRHVLHEEVTQNVFGRPDAKILEINSKSGLYPLYVAYSLYRQKLGDVSEDAVKQTELAKLWREVVARSLFVVCKTPMARAITRRTLVGYDDKATINAQYIKNLVELLKKEPKKFYNKVCGGNAWNNKEFEMKMLKFDAVVGNPPYQVEVAKKQSETNGQARRSSIFQYFQMAADAVSSGFTSLIYPGSRWIHR